MSNEKKAPKVLIKINNIRVLEYDDQNVKLEKFEEVYDPKSKLTSSKWRFIGYYRTVRKALETVIERELLVNKNEVNSLNDYLVEVRWANQRILAVLEADTQ